jgi:hypothetical protein
VGSDGGRYKTPALPSGVTVAAVPADADARKAGALGAGEVPNAGAAGNLCHVECANRGTCDAAVGVCRCFAGYHGEACGTKTDFLG